MAIYYRILKFGVPTTIVGTTVKTKVAGITVPPSIVETAAPASAVETMAITRVVPTRFAGTAVPATFVVTVVPTNVVGTPVLRILPARLANLITKPCQNFLWGTRSKRKKIIIVGFMDAFPELRN